jgi:hypothetical protein
MLPGCNSENLPGLGRVSGTITMDGKPVPNAAVAFEPADGKATAAIGRTDESGKYELYYSRGHKGAALGDNTVRINTYQETGDDDNRQIQKETVPAKYNALSELKAKVAGGSNKLDFELKSGGEIVQPGADETEGKKSAKKVRSRTGCG